MPTFCVYPQALATISTTLHSKTQASAQSKSLNKCPNALNYIKTPSYLELGPKFFKYESSEP